MPLEIINYKIKRPSFEIGPINLKMEPGTVTVICGKNGSGKSSILSSVFGFPKRVSGDILINGESIFKMNSRLLSRKISLVQQEFPIPLDFTVNDILELSTYGGNNEKITKLEALEMCGVEDFLNRDFLTLSGGEKRMVMIAASIYQNSDYMFLDEPVSYLDPDKISLLFRIILKMKEKGKGILMVLQDVNQAWGIADNVILMKRGVVLYNGRKDEVLKEENLSTVYDGKFMSYDSPEGKRFFIV
ncbi:ABC transporter ATP-binding protein [Caldiplasma sukawensis]